MAVTAVEIEDTLISLLSVIPSMSYQASVKERWDRPGSDQDLPHDGTPADQCHRSSRRPDTPIHEQHVEMHVEVQRRAKPLHQRHRAGRAGRAAGTGEACLVEQMA
jgi:hypothetical protein